MDRESARALERALEDLVAAQDLGADDETLTAAERAAVRALVRDPRLTEVLTMYETLATLGRVGRWAWRGLLALGAGLIAFRELRGHF
jgi:hypothetical protein